MKKFIPILFLWSLFYFFYLKNHNGYTQSSTYYIESSKLAGMYLSKLGSGVNPKDYWFVQTDQPPVPKYLFGLSWLVFNKVSGTWNAMIVVLFLAGIASIILMYKASHTIFKNQILSIVSVLLFLLTPGIGYFFHTVSPEGLMVFFTLLLLFLTIKSTSSFTLQLVTTFAYVIAFAVHHQLPWLFIPMTFSSVIYLSLQNLNDSSPRDRDNPETYGKNKKNAPSSGVYKKLEVPFLYLIAPFLGIFVLFLVWPTLKNSGLKGLDYYLFHYFRSPHPLFIFHGTLYDQATSSPPPWYAGILIILNKVNLVILFMFLWGTVKFLMLFFKKKFDETAKKLLFPASFLLTFLLIDSLNGTPFYQHLHLYLPALPLIILMAVYGIYDFSNTVLSKIKSSLDFKKELLVKAGIFALILLYSLVSYIKTLPFEIFYTSGITETKYNGKNRGTSYLVEPVLFDSILSDIPDRSGFYPKESGYLRIIGFLKSDSRFLRVVEGVKKAECVNLFYHYADPDFNKKSSVIKKKKAVLTVIADSGNYFTVYCKKEVKK